ncbi:MAG: beta-lactamase family protein [Deltaproteobacteria bacterium]|nr:beta-lactamase family protein [Deltaproteobacteria bacterium]
MTDPTPPSAPIDGDCDPRFSAVREAFAANFADQDEIGAGVCVIVNGRKVVDLWGGHQDAARTHAWQHDTLVNAYSVGKGVAAMLLLASVEAGEIDLDAPVARWWPEFAAQGKGEVTVRQLASHQAGLPAVRKRLPEDAWLDWDTMCSALADQRPYWEPGTDHGYHTNTFGFLIGELIRRATGVPIGDLLAGVMAEIAVDGFFYGLPLSQHHRVAEVVAPQVKLTTPEEWAVAFPATGDEEHDYMVWHCYFNPSGLSGIGSVNTAPWRSAVIPSTNGHATARAVAALYDSLLGRAPSGRPWPGTALLREATSIQADGLDRVLGRPSRFGIGFQLATPERPLGRSAASFGHFGYGGALGFADPEAGVAFGYLMNRPGERWQTPRTQRLVDAVYGSLG